MLPITAVLGAAVYLAFTINVFLGLIAAWVAVTVLAVAYGQDRESERQEQHRPHQLPPKF